MGKNIDTEIVENITSKIEVSLRLWYGEKASLVSSWPLIHKYRYSYILEYEISLESLSSVSILVKVDRHFGAGNIGGRKVSPILEEYYLMKSIENMIHAVDKPYLKAIKLVDFFPQWNAMVMEKFAGQLLKTYIYKNFLFFPSKKSYSLLAKATLNAGEWLKTFHTEVGKATVHEFRVDNWMTEVQAEVELFLPRIEKSVDIMSLLLKFKHAANSLDKHPVTHSYLHGDFNFKNIILQADGCIASFDPNYPKRGSIYHDLARIVTDIDTLMVQALSQGIVFNKKVSKTCENNLLKGYFNNEKYDSRFLALYSAYAYLKKWRLDEHYLELRRINKYVDAHLISPYIRHYFLNCINKELNTAVNISGI